ncbi:anti-sigma regulatory factor (Ser/Thr protein kinase) [Streptosporangium becharense]|uniref:Anti-sigma regulatory factor (Ser/Thr protein kinase) n=1 Tax=Streptosporangium becharense TaxID=1816182 RepID=A0A7W9IB95_9ACTN|nr:ATP-binding protein [Streptosporangium becharense]MBB2910675.1 anti-sigma regulatory factor (Ser/Thr protein kinase) [Streptosporangium becharense]MBB5817370.1 anti-sigma regulatory factor (Ser/Thr protein kinase) [Streptosporangium becharense]
MSPETYREIHLTGDHASPARARDEVRRWLGEEHPAYEAVRLVVSELVTNAVLHARYGITGPSGAGPLVLRLVAYGGLLRVEVSDAGLAAGGPRVRAEPAGLLAESGRGLAIVAALSGGSWGHRSHGREPGRTVWCEVPARPSPPEESPPAEAAAAHEPSDAVTLAGGSCR